MPHTTMINKTRKFTSEVLRKIRHAINPPPAPVLTPMPRRRAPSAPPLPEEEDLQLQALGQQFIRELFEKLLAELPRHRQDMARAYDERDYLALRNSVHQILGAAVYCNTGLLEEGLRELHEALKVENPHIIDVYYHRVIATIDALLRLSSKRN